MKPLPVYFLILIGMNAFIMSSHTVNYSASARQFGLINAYIKDADQLAQITSDLHQNIQDIFNEAGVEIMSPHYFAGRDGSATTIPEDYLKSK